MRLIILGKPPLVLEHPKAIEIVRRYYDGEKIGTLETEYDFNISYQKAFIFITPKQEEE